jgi:predicted Na+-dependent transporter
MGTYTLDTVGLLSLAVQVLLPIFVGLVTNAKISAAVKAVILLLLTAVGQLLMTWLSAATNHTHEDWKTWLWSTVVGFVLAVAVHFGLWKPTGVSAGAQSIGSSTKVPPPQ